MVTVGFAGSFEVAGATTVTSAGGGKGAITVGVDASDTVNGDIPLFGRLNTPTLIDIVSPTITLKEFSDAATLSAIAGRFAGGQTFTELINKGGHIQCVSNSRMTFDPFIVPQHGEVIPEPRSSLLSGTGLVAGASLLRRKAGDSFRDRPAKSVESGRRIES